MPSVERRKGIINDIQDAGKHIKLILEGDLYFVWEAKLKDVLTEALEIGDYVEIEYVPGDYPKLKDIKFLEHGIAKPAKSETGQTQLAGPAPVGGQALQQSDTTAHRIAKSVALKCAVDATGPWKEEASADEYAMAACNLADKFTKWLEAI